MVAKSASSENEPAGASVAIEEGSTRDLPFDRELDWAIRSAANQIIESFNMRMYKEAGDQIRGFVSDRFPDRTVPTWQHDVALVIDSLSADLRLYDYLLVTSVAEARRLLLDKQMRRLEEWKLNYGDSSFPIEQVAIETVGNCNRECSYCPVAYAPKRKGRMDAETVSSIAEQLAEVNFAGPIRLNFYNEPLLDKRLPDFIELIREHLPYNMISFATNGDLLDLEMAERLVKAGVTMVQVSLHDADIDRQYHELATQLPSTVLAHFEPLFCYSGGKEMFNRSGNVDPGTSEQPLVAGAGLDGCEFVNFHIDYLGNIHPCCHDFGDGYVLGNVLETPLVEIYRLNKQNFEDHFSGFYTRDVCLRCVGLK